jgi:hypothetical protein
MKIDESMEKHVDMVEFDVDLSEQEIDQLCNYALEHIKNDKKALVNYAVNDILKEMIDSTKKNNKFIKKLLKKDASNKEQEVPND